jgi:hypothetical protein
LHFLIDGRRHGPCVLDVLPIDERLLLPRRGPDQPRSEEREWESGRDDEKGEDRADA